MIEKPTLQDIAKMTGVTPATVHKALNNLKGVSEKKKKEILSVAAALNYTVSKTIAAPKRTVVALFPAPIGEDKIFYQFIWSGLERREEELPKDSLRIIKITFNGTVSDQIEKMEQIYSLYKDHINGLMTVIWDEDRTIPLIRKYTEAGIRVYTVASDAPHSERVSSMMVDPLRTGKLAAEYMGSVLSDFCRVIVIGTKRDALNHASIVRGFFDQMSITNPKIQIIEIYESKEYPERLLDSLNEFLTKFDDIKGIYANNARTTARLIEAYKGRERKILFLGSELFSDSMKAVEDGVIQAVVDQNAFKMAYDSVTNIYNNLVLGREIPEINHIPCSLYLRNNLPEEYPEKGIEELLPRLDKEFQYDTEDIDSLLKKED